MTKTCQFVPAFPDTRKLRVKNCNIDSGNTYTPSTGRHLERLLEAVRYPFLSSATPKRSFSLHIAGISGRRRNPHRTCFFCRAQVKLLRDFHSDLHGLPPASSPRTTSVLPNGQQCLRPGYWPSKRHGRHHHTDVSCWWLEGLDKPSLVVVSWWARMYISTLRASTAETPSL